MSCLNLGRINGSSGACIGCYKGCNIHRHLIVQTLIDLLSPSLNFPPYACTACLEVGTIPNQSIIIGFSQSPISQPPESTIHPINKTFMTVSVLPGSFSAQVPHLWLISSYSRSLRNTMTESFTEGEKPFPWCGAARWRWFGGSWEKVIHLWGIESVEQLAKRSKATWFVQTEDLLATGTWGRGGGTWWGFIYLNLDSKC